MSINPTNWRFYTGSFISNEAASLADYRDIAALQAATTSACTPGPDFNPARCSYLAQALGRIQTQNNCGKSLLGGGGTQKMTPASANVPSQGQVLAATNALATTTAQATAGALGSSQLNNNVCNA
jgi:hypothetical protein